MLEHHARDGFLDSSALHRVFANGRADALLASSVGSVFVASGHRTWLDEKMQRWMASPCGDESPRAGYAVVLPNGKTGLVANGVARADAQACGHDIVVLFGRGQRHSAPEAALNALLHEMELVGKRVGWEAQVTPREAMEQAAPMCSFVDASLTWRVLKSVKSARAIDTMRRVCAMTERALNESLPSWTRRDDPHAARRRFMSLIAESGAEFDHFAWGMAGGGVSVRLPPPRDSGALFFDAGARLDGFYSDTGLTLTHGACSSADERRYADALGVLNAGRAKLRAGVRASQAWHAMQSASPDSTLVAQGHGLGTSIREWPFFGAETGHCVHDGIGEYEIDQPLVEGMVINLEVAGHWPDGASVQVEQTFLIEADGARRLADQPRDHPLILN
ncbi:Metallopeptidase family M24 [Caballeronia glebae]|uniref:Metallopeptidase family M24 n=1 Tax=Caballeronia glebae TaxID=1777143 RepID=A0A158A3N9_9BURK|nr:M24 family metallopeptidase [Caballeronia glebae]SAK52464.1 Metallopeptidase family M24 [Caballeronia glebae]